MDIPVGLAVKAAREHMGLTKRDLAKLAGISRQSIYKVESALLQPKLITLEAIAIGLDIELWRIIRYADKLRKRLEAA